VHPLRGEFNGLHIVAMRMKNPPQSGKLVLHDCIEPLNLTIIDATALQRLQMT
jgi:hypothetical protein